MSYRLTDPCIGYVIRESSGPQRKLAILGDTHDPSNIIPLCLSPSPSLLIHEATDAHIPRHIDPKARRSAELVSEKALSRGHSTPAMAGRFAKKIGAERLVLNHIGGRYVFVLDVMINSHTVFFVIDFLHPGVRVMDEHR